MSTDEQKPAPTAAPAGDAPAPAEGGAMQYPPQLHAGAVGIGPNYKRGPDIGDKFDGLKEELKGKILHKPEVAQHGHEKRTGELQEKELTDDADSPFKKEEKAKADAAEKATTAAPSTQPATGGAPRAIGGNVHGSDKGAAEQAATVAPEGTKEAEVQRKGEAGADVVDAKAA